jgi:hypothetical protein
VVRNCLMACPLETSVVGALGSRIGSEEREKRFLRHAAVSSHFQYEARDGTTAPRRYIIIIMDVLPFVCPQGQFDSVYFELSQAICKVPYNFFFWTSSEISNCLHFTIINSEVTCEVDHPSFVF